MSEDIPKFDENPAENLNARVSRFEQQTEQEAVLRKVQEQEQRFAAEHPDYYEALNHLREQAKESYSLAGVPDEEIEQRMAQDELRAAAQIVKNGGDPAGYMYSQAKQRGFEGVSQAGSDDNVLEELHQELYAR